jgi:hypothetical protein
MQSGFAESFNGRMRDGLSNKNAGDMALPEQRLASSERRWLIEAGLRHTIPPTNPPEELPCPIGT